VKEVKLVEEPEIETKPQVAGPECPTCGDRFPNKESLQEHINDAHKLTS
jgi:hypothetical protein